MAPAYLTAAEVAERWGCSASYVRGLGRRGELVGMRLGSDWRFAVAVVEGYEAANTTPTPESRGKPAPKHEEVRPPTKVDGFTLPADYEPVFKDLWPGHEATTKRAPSVRR